MRRRAEELQEQMAEEVERVRRSLRAEIVPYKAYDVIPAAPAKRVRISVERAKRRGGDG
jgi:hypothetical protein